MREINPDLIKAHTAVRFRSEYDYALFKYNRSAKVIAILERAGVTLAGARAQLRMRWRRHAALARRARCRGRGYRSVRPLPRRGHHTRAQVEYRTSASLAPMVWRCRSSARSLNLVLSHAVIEHVSDALLYLKECRRVLEPMTGGCYLSTAPYLSFRGRAPAALARADSAAPDRRPTADRLPDVPLAGTAGALDAQRAGVREHVHPQCRSAAS